MGFRKPMDYNQVSHQIYMTGIEICNPKNDGFTSSYMKEDLYRLKWLIDAIIADSPTFVGEDKFLEEHSKDVMWRTLAK
jgi:vancomycin permeability regulator SanA